MALILRWLQHGQAYKSSFFVLGWVIKIEPPHKFSGLVRISIPVLWRLKVYRTNMGCDALKRF